MKKHNYYKISLLFCILLINPVYSEIDEQQRKLLETLPPDQRDAILNKIEQADKLTEDIEEKFEKKDTLVRRDEYEDTDKIECPECIYGYEFFKYAPSTFAPTDNISIPSDYVLGPGDLLEVSLFGNEAEKVDSYVSREGIMDIPFIGPVNVLGLTFNQAQELIRKRVSAEVIGSDAYLSLKELRSISVYLLGEAYTPGRYTLSG